MNKILKYTLTTALYLPINVSAASDEIEKYGDAFRVLIPAIAYGSTFLADDDEGRNQFYKSFITNIGATYGLKAIVDKRRPNGSSNAFPSGHTSMSFQAATFINQRYGLKYSIPAFIGATFVGYSRVQSDNHDIEDVLAGAAIGIASSYFFVSPLKEFNIHASAHNNVYGINISRDW